MIKLSPSGSSRWLKCPGSVLREEGLEDSPSKFAQEGTEAHTIAAKILEGKEVDETTPAAIIEYVNYIQELKDNCPKNVVFIENKLYSLDKELNLQGTADYMLLDINRKHLHVVDLKYGRGVVVEAENNSQLLIYGYLGYESLGFNYEIEYITMHIVQPRIKNYCYWSINIEELNNEMKVIKKIGKEALSGKGKIEPSKKTCQFCRAKPICTEHLQFIAKENDYMQYFEKI